MNWLFNLLISKLKDYVLKNWKTTLLGVVGTILTRYIPDPSLRETILTAIVAGLALLAKDGDSTGTVEQPRTPPEVVQAQTSALRDGIRDSFTEDLDAELDRLRSAGG